MSKLLLLCAALIALSQTLVFAAQSQPLLLQANEGEQRARRPRPGVDVRRIPAFTIKVDGMNDGSRNFVMLAEDLRPGAVIPWHRHLHEDEIVYTENGSIYARVGDRAAALGPHATIYIPQRTWVTIKNTSSETIRLLAIFDRPGYDAFLRCISVPAGQVARPMRQPELQSCYRAGDAEYR